MDQLDKLLEFCREAYSKRECHTDTTKCSGASKCMNKNCSNCEDCLQDIHDRDNSSLDYTCEYQTYFYVMKFFYRYASEICIVLHEYLKPLLQKDSIDIVSIGCGPSSELYGIRAFQLVNASDVHINYFGFDFNTIWKNVQQKNQAIISEISVNYDTIDGFDFIRNSNGVDLLVLNYVLSDLARRNNPSAIAGFLGCLEEIIKYKKADYILINDIYLTYTTRSAYALMRDFVRFCIANGIRKENIVRYQYKDPNVFQAKFGDKPEHRNIIFRQNVNIDDVGPWLDLRSMGVVIKVK